MSHGLEIEGWARDLDDHGGWLGWHFYVRNPVVVLWPIAHGGEIGQAKLPKLMTLAENHFLLRTMEGAQGPNPALKRAPHARVEISMTPLHLVEDGNRPEAGRNLQHWHYLLIP